MEAQLSGLGVICQSAEGFQSLSSETSKNKPVSSQHSSTEENSVLKALWQESDVWGIPCLLLNVRGDYFQPPVTL